MAMKNSGGQSMSSTKPITDTQCYTVDVIQTMLIAGQQRDILLGDIKNLNQRISEKEAIIKQLEKNDSVSLAIIDTYKREIAVMKDQRGIYEGELKVIQKQLKKEKRKRIFTGIVGIATTAIAFYIGSR